MKKTAATERNIWWIEEKIIRHRRAWHTTSQATASRFQPID